MQVFLTRKKSDIEAIGEFDLKTKELKVLKGSKLSKDIAFSPTFRGAGSIEKRRKGKVINNILQEDVLFNSPSTASNFVTGRSTNGLTLWKNKDGKNIKELINEG